MLPIRILWIVNSIQKPLISCFHHYLVLAAWHSFEWYSGGCTGLRCAWGQCICYWEAYLYKTEGYHTQVGASWTRYNQVCVHKYFKGRVIALIPRPPELLFLQYKKWWNPAMVYLCKLQSCGKATATTHLLHMSGFWISSPVIFFKCTKLPFDFQFQELGLKLPTWYAKVHYLLSLMVFIFFFFHF